MNLTLWLGVWKFRARVINGSKVDLLLDLDMASGKDASNPDSFDGP